MEFIDKLNEFGRRREKILFAVSYDKSRSFVYPLDQLPDNILFDFDGVYGNTNKVNLVKCAPVLLSRKPVSFDVYQKSFDQVIQHIKQGDVYMLNLTFPTEVSTSSSLTEIFHSSSARYKFLLDDEFVCFSPEQFVKVKNDRIMTFPIKGTIRADVCDAANIILNDPKEKAEHTMVVDLLRNDLGIIGEDVRVDRFRFIDKIPAGQSELLQVTSEISASLPSDWRSRLGDLIFAMLPAGSISGTPKSSALKVIDEVELDNRGYFCGIAGVFDGENLDSCVLIRFIEKRDGKLIYRSGGGITVDSNPSSEYLEILDKVYVPVF